MIFLLLACPAPGTGEPAVLVEDCATAGDEDEDGVSDCADPDCWLPGVCREDCRTVADEDGDGLQGCEDPDCPCEDCGVPGDEEGDWLAECADPDCWLPGVCSEDCRTMADEDGDGLRGCEDPDCPPCEDDCATPGDEDGDGLADCFDYDCWRPGVCPEVCGHAGDEDGDGRSGCDDPDCQPCEDCALPGDEDGNGRADCDDVRCAASGLCVEVCQDIRDNDGDNAIDEPPCPTCPARTCGGCADVDCQYGPREGQCTNGRDDDCDGLVDCADPDCPYFTSEDCDGDRDADCDGLLPWHDEDCDTFTAHEQCRNGRDDDGDGLVDCEDGECAGTTFCDEICDNHVDDDLDGVTDCWDDDCWGPGCVGATAARVESGSAAWGALEVWEGWGYGWGESTYVATLRAKDVRGRLRVADGYGGTDATCVWTVRTASAESRVDADFGWSWAVRTRHGPFARCDASFASPCPVGGTRMLPRGAVVGDGIVRLIDGVERRTVGFYSYAYVWSAGAAWYVPSGSVSPTRSSSEWAVHSGTLHGGGGRVVETATFPLGEGAWYYAPPAP